MFDHYNKSTTTVNISVKRLDIDGALAIIASIYANMNSVPVINGENFKDWKENMKIVLDRMDLDLALRMKQPTSLTESNTSEHRKYYEKCDHSNRTNLMIIKHDILEVFRGTISEEITNAKDFIAEIEKRIVKSDKAETSTLL
ncbi:hypothetical protein KIW84_033679 [Lathyrus oleraceus]|uniref:Uncharacterized protein n=1 Tax=Pisum sativum TaxID=3888 RepID=A0A9D5B3E7_PEA|nr:hypothetical protein KIW84_033679 [Pisum sativum]